MHNRFLNLDALRGIAALLVVWQHSSESFVRNPGIAQHGTALADIAATVDFGRIGVICFFLISGFVIPYSLSGANASLKTFAIRRFFRLYPAYWLSLAVAVGLAAVLGYTSYSAGTIAANTTMLQGLLGFKDIQGLYWTLTVEFIFYCLCAAAFAFRILDKRTPLLLMCWGSLGLFVAWRLAGKVMPQLTDLPPTVTYIPYCLAVMFCGALIRHCYSAKSDYIYAFLGTAAVFVIPLLILIAGFAGIDLVNDPLRFGSSHLIGLAVFFAVLLVPTRPPRFLLLLGTVSYSLYLFHPIAMRLLSTSIRQEWGQAFAQLPLGVYMLATALLSTAIAWGVYHLCEKPAISIGRSLTNSNKKGNVDNSSGAAVG